MIWGSCPMQMIRGSRGTLRNPAVIVMAGLCLGAIPAVFMAGSASAQGSSTTVAWWGRSVHNKPFTVTLPAPVTEVGTNNSAWYALLNNGQVWAWGYELHGELGNGTSGGTLVTTPVQVQFPAG